MKSIQTGVTAAARRAEEASRSYSNHIDILNSKQAILYTYLERRLLLSLAIREADLKSFH